MPAFYIDQHGCAKNQVDGEEISARLIDAGFSASASPEDADIIIVNTCGFIEEAKKNRSLPSSTSKGAGRRKRWLQPAVFPSATPMRSSAIYRRRTGCSAMAICR